MQLQLSLTLADDLHDLLLRAGEPIDFIAASSGLLAVSDPPPDLAREAMRTLVEEDRRFAWFDPNHIGLADCRDADPDLSEVSFVVVDLETTGTNPQRGRITEIGAVRIQGLREVAAFHSLVNPLRPIPPEIVRLTGITTSMVRRAPRIEKVIPEFLEFLEGAVLVAHNARFDLGFLNHELSRLNGKRLGEGAIDTVRLARHAAPGLRNHKLATVAEALGSPTTACHRALADARATAHIFLTLIGRMQERRVTRLQELRSRLDPSHRSDRHKIALTQGAPERPGVYQFRNGDGRILYVGRAENLRDRVRSHFSANGGHSRRIRRAIEQLESVTWEETGTPLRAVAHEHELILRQRPPANSYGSRPESYVYLKAGGYGPGLRLYQSDRLESVPSGSPGERTETLVLGPFRGRSRLSAALDTLRRCYAVRKCNGTRRGHSQKPGPCFYGETAGCLAPCTQDEGAVRSHDYLVLSLLAWFGHKGDSRQASPGAESSPGAVDPSAEAASLVRRLSDARRYEDAEEAHRGMDALISVRRSYRALAETRELDGGVLHVAAPSAGAGDGRTVHLDIVSSGEIVSSFLLTCGTLEVEAGRAARLLAGKVSEKRRDAHWIAVPQARLDMLLAIRGWIKENPGAVHLLPADGHSSIEDGIEEWKTELIAECRRLVG